MPEWLIALLSAAGGGFLGALGMAWRAGRRDAEMENGVREAQQAAARAQQAADEYCAACEKRTDAVERAAEVQLASHDARLRAVENSQAVATERFRNIDEKLDSIQRSVEKVIDRLPQPPPIVRSSG